MRMGHAHATWTDWATRVAGRSEAERKRAVTELARGAGTDPDFAHRALGGQPYGWTSFAPYLVGLTFGAGQLDPHPLAAETDERLAVLGYLFDATDLPTWQVVTFLLGVAAGRAGFDGALLQVFGGGTMSQAEQAALVLAGLCLRPSVAVEAGTFHGGSTALLAAHAERVVTIDWHAENVAHVAHLANVSFVHGTASARLPGVLAANPAASLVLLDADHHTDAVAAEADAVLAAPVADLRVTFVHDAGDAACRAGILAADWGALTVRAVKLDAVTRHRDGNGMGGMTAALQTDAGPGANVDDRQPAPEVWPFADVTHPVDPPVKRERGLIGRLRR